MIQNFKNLNKFKKSLIENGYYVGNRYDNGEFILIKKIISKFDIFIDCGFYIGDISKDVRKISNKIKILGFDFNKNFSLASNKTFLKKNINFVNIGLSDKNQTLRVYNYKNRPELSSLKKRYDYNPKLLKTEFSQTKKMVKLDNYKKEFKPTDNIFLKIDTDGSEEKILKGAEKILENYNVSGYFEYGTGFKNFKSTLKKVFNFMYNKNYRIYRLTKSGLINYRYYSQIDENFFQSHYFFTKDNLKKFKMKRKKIISLTSDKLEDFYLF